MKGVFSMIASTILGSIGWWIGDFIGIGTALVVSSIATGFGIYWGKKLHDHWLG